MFRFFFFLFWKIKYSCHLKHVCRNICELISYSLCYMVMMWCINLNQIITTHIKICFNQNKRYIGRTLKKMLHFFFGPLIISIILFHIIWWGEHYLFCNTLKVQTTMREENNACPNIKKIHGNKCSIINHNLLDILININNYMVNLHFCLVFKTHFHCIITKLITRFTFVPSCFLYI
jgi:hypothetical protein